MKQFGRCGKCGKPGWLVRSKRLKRVVCQPCVVAASHKTLEKVICAPCGMLVTNVLTHMKMNPRCPASDIELASGNAAGRGPGQGYSYRNSRKVPWDVEWDNEDHVVDEVT